MSTYATEQALEDQIHEKAALTVKQLQERARGTLDYSVASLEMIEEILDEASHYRAELQPDDIETLVSLVGSYILEVGYRQNGGSFAWNTERNQPVLVVGEPRFHVAMMTFDKVKGRLSGDKSDNIPFFYQGFLMHIKMAKHGTRVLVV